MIWMTSSSVASGGADLGEVRASPSISSYSFRNAGFDITARNVGASTIFMALVSECRKCDSRFMASRNSRSINVFLLSWCMRLGMKAGGCGNTLRHHAIPVGPLHLRKDSLA